MPETFITFSEEAPNKKTKRWGVFAKEGRFRLGQIAWFGRWRCYSFLPLADTVFEQRCLRDIADFCESQTKLQREAAAIRRTEKDVA